MINSTTKKAISLELLKQRYPDLGFLLSFFPYEEWDLPKDPHPLHEWLKGKKLDEVEIIYLIGLIDFDLPKELMSWLKKKKERALVFVEKKLGAFACFSDEKLMGNPQVHFHYAESDPVEILAQQFPTEKLLIFEGSPFPSEKLQRRSAAYSALYSDLLYSHEIVKNVLSNYQAMENSFDARGSFQNTPAIICGAGPSLAKSLPELKKMRDRALIFAGGTAITALTKGGLQPHFAMALDPNPEEFQRLKQAHYFEGSFLFAPRLHRDVFATVNGPFGYMKTDTGGLIENWLEKELGLTGEPIGPDLGDEAFSVTTLALSYAYALGCNPIIFVGVDLAYTGGKRYVDGVDAEEEKGERLIRSSINGKEIETQLKWVMESDSISKFAKDHPKVLFLNATEDGIGFEGIENTTLEKALKGKPMEDFQGILHQWIQQNPFALKKEMVPKLLQELETSLKRCETFTLEILEELKKKRETGKLTILEADFSEEIAYKALLEGIGLALEHLTHRYYPELDPEIGKWQRKIARYRELKEQIDKFGLLFAEIGK